MIDLKSKALSLPLQPGVYIMMDKQGQVIYIGKAKQLKSRVSQYFQDTAVELPKTAAMVSQVHDFDVIIAASEFDALLLECSLIKRHQPKYNILLKDAKGYPFIGLTAGTEYPRFFLAAKKDRKEVRYFGPYGSRGTTKSIINALLSTFKLPTCRRQFPRDIGKERPCLNYHLGRCLAPCNGYINQREYGDLIDQAVLLLEGKGGKLAAQIYEQMQAASEKLEFEHAGQLRDKYNAVSALQNRQIILPAHMSQMDVIGYYEGQAKNCVAVLHYREGQLISRDIEMLDSTVEKSTSETVSDFIKQYYGPRQDLPKSILLPCDIEDKQPVEEFFTRNAGKKIEVLSPKRGEKTKLLLLAEKNAREEAERATTGQERQNKAMTQLGRALAMESLPRRIEAFDVSNTAGGEIVAAMTVFEQAQPRKKDYRYYKIKGIDTQDDYESMREAVGRRFARYLQGDDRFGALPDLLLIDGGAAHAAAAQGVLQDLGMELPVFGMVKDDRHRTRALTAPDGAEIGLNSTILFSFVGRIQEETHRFAIGYHRKLRAKRGYGSVLDEVPGVGQTRKRALLKHFKSIKAIRAASETELAAVLPSGVARAVYTHLHQPKGKAGQ